jgi:hypothetical protein
MRDTRTALIAHVGGNPSVTQELRIDRAVQLIVRMAAMDRKFVETEVQTEHDSRTYLAWTGRLLRILRDLGLEAAAVPPPTLAGIDWSRSQGGPRRGMPPAGCTNLPSP